jgi:hypothetical protein
MAPARHRIGPGCASRVCSPESVDDILYVSVEVSGLIIESFWLSVESKNVEREALEPQQFKRL